MVDDEALAQQLTRVAWQLVPVFRTDFTRRSWQLSHGGAVVEVALDEGAITTGNAQGNHRQAILELELELLSGPVDALLDLAHTLALGPQGQAGGALRLLPAQQSKAERGYALFTGERPRPLKAAELTLEASWHPVQVFQAAALSCLTHLQANEAGVRQRGADGTTPDPEFVHQARVALRRLRTGLRLFRPHLPPRFAAHWAAEWKALAAELGPARDWDVFATERLPHWGPGAGTVPPMAAPSQALVHWLVQQRQAAHRRAAEAVNGAAHALRLLAFTRAVLALPVPATHNADLAAWARNTLRARHAALREEARRAQRMGPEGRHQLRIALKKLRYAQSFWPRVAPGGWRAAGHLAVHKSCLVAQRPEHGPEHAGQLPAGLAMLGDPLASRAGTQLDTGCRAGRDGARVLRTPTPGAEPRAVRQCAGRAARGAPRPAAH